MAADGIAQAVGAGLKDFRTAHALSQDNVARAVRAHGLRWDRHTITELENGQKPLSVAELVVLLLSLTELSGQPVGLAALLAGCEVPVGNAGFSLPGDVVVRLLAGEGVTLGASRQQGEPAGEAEEKAARKLRVPKDRVVTVARQLWGRTLTEERDARLPEGSTSSRAAKGHITRALLAELRDRLESPEGA